MQTKAGKHIQALLATASVTIGTEDGSDIQVRDESFIQKALAGGQLAIGEGYMDEKWRFGGDPADILCRIFDAGLEHELRGNKWAYGRTFLLSALTNPQTVLKSRLVGKFHYDLPSFLFDKMLGGRDYDYSCLRWGVGVDSINQAQQRKYMQIAAKLHLKPGMRVLDIGCGRGGLAKFLATYHGVSIVGITISGEQAIRAQEACEGLDVKILVMDYRELDLGQFDRIVSIGMLEHVGPKNLDHYMRLVRDALKPGGIFLCHSIVGSGKMNPWIDKYIFRGGIAPQAWMVEKAAQKYFRAPEDWENFGSDYYHTLMAWHGNCVTHRQEINARCGAYLAATFGSVERFWRMWDFYLLGSAARFKVRATSVGQWIFVKGGTPGIYQTSRPPLATTESD